MPKNKVGNYIVSLNELKIDEKDPTIKRGKVFVFDFEVSGNGQIITEEVAKENINTLVGKRITCKYISKSENGGELDALGDHAENEGTDRDDEPIPITDTIAIGFIEKAYIEEYQDNNGITKKGVFADIIIWCDDKYANIVGLLEEWLDRGIKINMSVEYYYFNYNKKEGIEYIQSPIYFNAHTLLNSEDRGNSVIITPSYEYARLISLNEIKKYNKAINSLLENKIKNSKKEETEKMENKFLKALNELSCGDLREKIMEALKEKMTAAEYEYVWISNYGIYPEGEYFLYETYEDKEWINYKINYSVDDNDKLTVDYENKEKVTYALVSANSLKEIETELETTKNSLAKSEETVNELNEKIISLNDSILEKSNNSKAEKGELEKSINELQAKIDKMQPLVDKYNEELFNKSFNVAHEHFKKKFESVNALDVFEEESTQELIKQYANEDENISKEAKYALNALVVENIKEVKLDDDDLDLGNSNISINQITKLEDKNEELIKHTTDDILREKYGIDYE